MDTTEFAKLLYETKVPSSLPAEVVQKIYEPVLQYISDETPNGAKQECSYSSYFNLLEYGGVDTKASSTNLAPNWKPVIKPSRVASPL